MPTYEYICQKCKHQFELYQPITEQSLTVCPRKACARKPWGKGKVQRMISAGAGLIFKGSGFYITDYRSKEYKQAAKKETSPPAATSTDSKSSSPSSTSSTTPTPTKSDSKK